MAGSTLPSPPASRKRRPRPRLPLPPRLTRGDRRAPRRLPPRHHHHRARHRHRGHPAHRPVHPRRTVRTRPSPPAQPGIARRADRTPALSASAAQNPPGTGLDPLSWKPEILTICIFYDAAFTKLFATMITGKTDEGTGGVLLAGSAAIQRQNRATGGAGSARRAT